MTPQYGELRPLAAEIVSLVWGTPANFNRFCILAALLHGTQWASNFAALNRGRHLRSAGRPSGWALAHILVVFVLCCSTFLLISECVFVVLGFSLPRQEIGLQNVSEMTCFVS